MNLRILKKLSKRAAPLLKQLGETSEFFPAERGECYTSSGGHDRKHWHRHPARYPSGFSWTRYYMPKHGEWHVAMEEPHTPLKGTVMVGWNSGYECPEWEENDAWTLLRKEVVGAFMVYKPHDDYLGGEWKLMRRFPNPSAIFRAAAELITIHQRKSDPELCDSECDCIAGILGGDHESWCPEYQTVQESA